MKHRVGSWRHMEATLHWWLSDSRPPMQCSLLACFTAFAKACDCVEGGEGASRTQHDCLDSTVS